MKTLKKKYDLEYKYLELVADALIEAGYNVENPPKDCSYLDIWGYIKPKGSKRRKKCYLEAYCSVFMDAAGYVYAYWHVDYEEGDEDICTTSYVQDLEEKADVDISNLLDALEIYGLMPLKGKVK